MLATLLHLPLCIYFTTIGWSPNHCTHLLQKLWKHSGNTEAHQWKRLPALPAFHQSIKCMAPPTQTQPGAARQVTTGRSPNYCSEHNNRISFLCNNCKVQRPQNGKCHEDSSFNTNKVTRWHKGLIRLRCSPCYFPTGPPPGANGPVDNCWSDNRPEAVACGAVRCRSSPRSVH